MFRYTIDLPDTDSLFSLFETTGWNEKYRLTSVQLHQAFRNSWFHVFAYADGRLVGSGRAICDGIVHALILDVIVHPEYQRMGIGKGIMDRIMEHCHKNDILDIQLFSARDKAGFYHKLKFRERPQNAPGMEWKPSDD